MPQGLKDMVSGGWHPDTNKGQQLNIRGRYSGVNKAAGLVGKAKPPETGSPGTVTHNAAPLSTLKDPSTFGPPPKHIAVHGADAASQSTHNGEAPANVGGPPPVPSSKPHTKPKLSNGSATPTGADLPTRGRLHQGTTEFQPLAPSTPSVAAVGSSRQPPRPPPRQVIRPGADNPPPSYPEATSEEYSEKTGYMNQAAVSQLGKSGVSVPSLGIGGNGQSATAYKTQSTPSSPSSQINELQTRFAQMPNGRRKENPDSTASSGTTTAQKESALKTANSFRNDPSSVSISDAKASAATARNFQQRHGSQLKEGLDKANSLSQERGPGNEAHEAAQYLSPTTTTEDSNIASAVAVKRKPPPPPKRNKPLVSGPDEHQQVVSESGAPPVPLASKPRPG